MNHIPQQREPEPTDIPALEVDFTADPAALSWAELKPGPWQPLGELLVRTGCSHFALTGLILPALGETSADLRPPGALPQNQQITGRLAGAIALICEAVMPAPEGMVSIYSIAEQTGKPLEGIAGAVSQHLGSRGNLFRTPSDKIVPHYRSDVASMAVLGIIQRDWLSETQLKAATSPGGTVNPPTIGFHRWANPQY